MSQKGEKYARRMERRMDKLEQDVAAIATEQTTQGVRISAVEDDLAVYRAAVSARELKQAAAEVKAAKERRTARAAERERKARRRNKVLAFIALALFVAVCVVMAYSEEPAAEPAAPEASAAPAAILPTELLFTAAAEEEYMEDPQEAEKIEEALLAQGYFSLAVPMPYEWQDYMRTYCVEYGCPYPLALAVAQTESRGLARSDEACTLPQLCAAAGRLLRYGGSFCLVFRAERMPELFACLKGCGMEPKRLRLVQNTAQAAPKLLLLEAKKGGRPGLAVLPPLLLRDPDGRESAELSRIYFRDKE